MAKSDGPGVIGRLLSQNSTGTKSEAVGSKAWKPQIQENVVCNNQLRDSRSSDEEIQDKSQNDLPPQLGGRENQPYESWRPPWKKKRVPVYNQTTMSPCARQRELSRLMKMNVVESDELFEHPCVVTTVEKVLKAKFREPGIEELCKEFKGRTPSREWNFDVNKVNSAYWSAVKTIKKRSRGGSPVLHNNPFDPRLKYHGMAEHILLSKVQTPTCVTSTVNIFLTVPDVSSVFESYSQHYRTFCNQLTATFDNHTLCSHDVGKFGNIVKLPDEYEKLRCLWESTQGASPLHHTIRRPHTSRWQRELVTSPARSLTSEPTNEDKDSDTSPSVSVSVDTEPASPLQSNFSSTPVSSSSSVSSSSTSPCSSVSSDEQQPVPRLPSTLSQLVTSTIKKPTPRRTARRRLWDDNDLLLTTGRCQDDDDMDVFPLTPISRSQSDPDLSRSFQDNMSASNQVPKWQRNFDDVKVELFPERQSESEAGDHVTAKRPMPKSQSINSGHQQQPQQMGYQMPQPPPHMPQPQHYQQVLHNFSAMQFPQNTGTAEHAYDPANDGIQQHQFLNPPMAPVRVATMRPQGYPPPHLQNAFYAGYAVQPAPGAYGQVPQMIRPPQQVPMHLPEGHPQFPTPQMVQMPDFRQPPPFLPSQAAAAYHLGQLPNTSDVQPGYCSAHRPQNASSLIYSTAGGNAKPKESSSQSDLTEPAQPIAHSAPQQTLNMQQLGMGYAPPITSANIFLNPPANSFQQLLGPTPAVPNQAQLQMLDQSHANDQFSKSLQNAKVQNRGFGGGAPFFPQTAFVGNPVFPILNSPSKPPLVAIPPNNAHFYQKPPQNFIVQQPFTQH